MLLSEVAGRSPVGLATQCILAAYPELAVTRLTAAEHRTEQRVDIVTSWTHVPCLACREKGNFQRKWWSCSYLSSCEDFPFFIYNKFTHPYIPSDS